MKKYKLLIFIFLFVNLSSFAQDTLAIKLINEFLTIRFKDVKEKILLSNKSFHLRLKDDVKMYDKKLKNNIDTISLNQMLNNSLLDTNWKKTWETFDTNKVILLTQKQVDSVYERNRIVKYNNSIVYIMSVPVFDNDKKYAIIDFGGGFGRTKMVGCKYLLKKVKNKWKVITWFSGWAA